MADAIPDVRELFIRVGDLTKRVDMAAMWKTALKLAEARMFRTLRFWAMEQTVTLTPDENGIITLPEDFLEARHVRLASATGSDLAGMSLHALNARYGRSGGTGKGFAIVGNTMVIRPSGGDVALTYYARPPSLAEVATNDVLAAAPDVYLYTVAREVAINARDAQLATTLDPMVMSAVEALELEDLGKRYGMQTVRLTGPTP